MILSQLVKNIDDVKIYGNAKVEIENLTTDSRCVTTGSMFICISGNDYDGHDFFRQAEKYGAVAILAERKLQTSLTQIIVKDCRKAMSVIADNFYGGISKKMKIIGATGTNGKTTTTHFIADILNSLGVKCGVIGTLGTHYGENFLEPTLTTPDPIVLHKTLADMYSYGYDTVVMEISAHANYYDKLYNIDFFAVVFTNFTRDHLDFFRDMETYKKAKLKLFENNKIKYIVANTDDELGRFIAKNYNGVVTYAIDNPADVFAIDLKNSNGRTEYVINLFDCINEIQLNIVGKFNVYNSLGAATVCALYGINPQKIMKKLSNLKSVSGRLEKVYNEKFDVYIDYAHTPDGLENSLKSLREQMNEDKKLICVFGCGGNRDQGKREQMGELSATLSDFTVITTDNPRYEEPMEIIFQIEKGVLKKSKNYVIIQERQEAIGYALNLAGEGDTILIAGKGGEKYQEILGIKRPFNDKDMVKEWTRGK